MRQPCFFIIHSFCTAKKITAYSQLDLLKDRELGGASDSRRDAGNGFFVDLEPCRIDGGSFWCHVEMREDIARSLEVLLIF